MFPIPLFLVKRENILCRNESVDRSGIERLEAFKSLFVKIDVYMEPDVEFSR